MILEGGLPFLIVPAIAYLQLVRQQSTILKNPEALHFILIVLIFPVTLPFHFKVTFYQKLFHIFSFFRDLFQII